MVRIRLPPGESLRIIGSSEGSKTHTGDPLPVWCCDGLPAFRKSGRITIRDT